jgi:hypothetical protein
MFDWTNGRNVWTYTPLTNRVDFGISIVGVGNLAVSGNSTVTGNSTVGGKFTANSGGSGEVAMGENPHGSIEIGGITRATAGTPFIDFHSSVGTRDFDVRMIVSGGGGSDGQGTINVQAASMKLNNTDVATVTNTVPRAESRDFGTIGSGGGTGTTASFLSYLNGLGFFNYARSTGKFTWDYAGNADITDTGIGNIELAGSVIEVWRSEAAAPGNGTYGNITIRVTCPNSGASANREFIYVDHGTGYNPGWRRPGNEVHGGTY